MMLLVARFEVSLHVKRVVGRVTSTHISKLPNLVHQRILGARRFHNINNKINNNNVNKKFLFSSKQNGLNGLKNRNSSLSSIVFNQKREHGNDNHNNNHNQNEYIQKRSTAVSMSNSSGSMTSNLYNKGGVFNVLFSPELVGIEQEAKRLDSEHKAAKIPFNLAFDAAFEQVPALKKKDTINVLEIGFGSGAVVEGTFDYFNNKFKNDVNSNNKKKRVEITGIDKESRWLDYCNKKFKNEINNKQLDLYEMDATNIQDLLHLRVDMKNKFDIILFRFFLSHVINFEGVFKYMVRYLLSRDTGALIIQDGILPSPAGTILLPQMHSLPDVIGSKYNTGWSNSVAINSINGSMKRTDPLAEFPNLFKFANETAAPVLSKVMRFDVEYVLPSLVKQCGMKTVWQNEMTLGGLNGTYGFEMAINNLVSNVTRFRLLGVISEDDAKKIIKEIEYAKTLPQSRSYVLLPLISSVVCHSNNNNNNITNVV